MHLEVTRTINYHAKRLREVIAEKDSIKIAHHIEWINALLMPKAFIGIDKKNRVHCTVLYGTVPIEVAYCSDVSWNYNAVEQHFVCIKSR